jgi:hypothetical protein
MTDEKITEQLDEFCSGLTYYSEADVPLDPVTEFVADKLDDKTIREFTKTEDDDEIERLSLDEIFEGQLPEDSSERDERDEQMTKLKDFLRDNLKDVQGFRIGEISRAILVLGKSDSGKWFGFQTESVET